jgi:hypothetical protein
MHPYSKKESIFFKMITFSCIFALGKDEVQKNAISN